MNNLLTIQDPLAGKAVEIRLTVGTSTGGRGERPMLLSLGIEGEIPVQINGRFSDLEALIHEAWQEAGKQTGSTPKAQPNLATDAKQTETKVAPAVSVADLF